MAELSPEASAKAPAGDGGGLMAVAGDDEPAGVDPPVSHPPRAKGGYRSLLLLALLAPVAGAGTGLVTEECLLNRNRNPTLNRGEIEARLRAYLGLERVIWLGKGVVNDETDGHIDNLACFVRPGEIVTLVGETLDDSGLLLDFKLLKQVLRPTVDYLDHQMINDLEPFTEINPSAENLARYFYDQTNEQLNGMTSGRVRVKDCTIWETDTTSATYYER